MANTGNIFPVTGENNAGIGATAWTAPTAIVSDNATDATCNAAASSQYLVARNFGFSIPAGAVIGGIVVRVEASEHSTSTESLNAQLQNSSLIGSSKAQTVNGTTKSVYTYGATNDVWGATLTPSIVNDANFGVRVWFTTAHDVRVDYITIAVEYTVPINVLPDVGALSLAGFSPSVSVTNNTNVSAGLGEIALNGFSPVVSVTQHQNITPGFGEVLIIGFSPTVETPRNVTPDLGVLTLNGFSPSVSVSDNKVVLPSNGELLLTGFEPSISIGNNRNVEPGTGELTLNGFNPSVSVTDHKVINPGLGEITINGFAPSVQTPVNISANYGEIQLNGFSPSVVASDHKNVSPDFGQLNLVGFEPTITIQAGVNVEPLTGSITITGFAPNVNTLVSYSFSSKITDEIDRNSTITYEIIGGSRIYDEVSKRSLI